MKGGGKEIKHLVSNSRTSVHTSQGSKHEIHITDVLTVITQFIPAHWLGLNVVVVLYLPPSASHNTNRQSTRKDQQAANTNSYVGCSERWPSPLANVSNWQMCTF